MFNECCFTFFHVLNNHQPPTPFFFFSLCGSFTLSYAHLNCDSDQTGEFLVWVNVYKGQGLLQCVNLAM